ncbi:MAG: VacJ family lipoprotein [Candidatus Pelagibacter bacterium]|nr:VacJ family lipoprotein [Candidatus Pelagibacter bacterium]
MKKIINYKNISIIFVFISLLILSQRANSTEECFENTSRAIFKFNMALDDAVLEPVAKGYNKLPSPIRKGASNFTSNIGTLLSIPNNIFQGNFKQLGQSVGSFAINTTVGILGFLNPAEKIGLNPHKEDVGQTLGVYGAGTGCYFVLPILGPTTARDSLGILADTFLDPFAHITLREKEIFSTSGNALDYYSVKTTGAIDFRAKNDNNFQSLEQNSLDLYSSMKSIYLQNRENKITNSSENEDEWGSLEN